MDPLPQTTFLSPTKEFRHLTILSAIYHHPQASQHKVALQTNLSSAMVNGYIKALSQQGLIEKKNRNQRDYNYFLTNTGKQELMSLLMGYAAEIVQFYSGAKREISLKLTEILNGTTGTRIVLHGASDTCELVLQSLLGFPKAQVVGIVDGEPEKQGRILQGHTVLAPTAIPAFKANMVIITSFAKQDEIYEDIAHLEQDGIKIRRLITI